MIPSPPATRQACNITQAATGLNFTSIQEVKEKMNKDACLAYNSAILKCEAEIEQEVEWIAQDHSKTILAVREVLTNATHYHPQQEPTLLNTKVHIKAIELNQGTVSLTSWDTDTDCV